MSIEITAKIPLELDSHNTYPLDLEVKRSGEYVELTLESEYRTVSLRYDDLRKVVELMKEESEWKK